MVKWGFINRFRFDFKLIKLIRWRDDNDYNDETDDDESLRKCELDNLFVNVVAKWISRVKANYFESNQHCHSDDCHHTLQLKYLKQLFEAN